MMISEQQALFAFMQQSPAELANLLGCGEGSVHINHCKACHISPMAWEGC